MVARIFAVFLVFWVWPGTSEAAEYAVHWLQDGDAVHGTEHHESDQGDDDGCPDSSHLCHLSACSCWSTTTPVLTKMTAPPVRAARLAVPPRPETHAGCEDPAPLIRPPIA